jgi:hypothetical protein
VKELSNAPLVSFLDLGKMTKFMSRTDSDNDAEALACLRQANAMLRKAGTGWGDMFVRLMVQDIKEEKKPADNLNAEEVLLHTINWLVSEGKLPKEVGDELIQTIRMMLVSKDTNFKRRTGRKIRSAIRSFMGQDRGVQDVPEM